MLAEMDVHAGIESGTTYTGVVHEYVSIAGLIVDKSDKSRYMKSRRSKLFGLASLND